MENSLHEFMKFKKVARLAYKYEHPYGPNISQFKGDMLEYEEKAQVMQNPTMESSRKRKKPTTDRYFALRSTSGAQPSIKSVLVGK